MYVIEFDNYLKSKPQTKQNSAHIRSFNDIIAPSDNAYRMLRTHLQNAPSSCRSFLEFACPYLFAPGMFAAVQGELIQLWNGSYIFSASGGLFGYISRDRKSVV